MFSVSMARSPVSHMHDFMPVQLLAPGQRSRNGGFAQGGDHVRFRLPGNCLLAENEISYVHGMSNEESDYDIYVVGLFGIKRCCAA